MVFVKDYLTVVRDCVVGRWTGGGAGAVSIEMLSALDKFGDASAAHELALMRVIDGAEVARFRCDRVCRACVALGEDRLLLIEGGDLVSRRNDGSDRVVVYAGIIGDEEALSGSLVTDGTIAALVVSNENERSTCRVVDIVRRTLRWERTIGGEGASVDIVGAVVLVLAWFDGDDATYFAFDAETGAERWSRVAGSIGYDPNVFAANVGRDGALLLGELGPDGAITRQIIDIESGAVRATGDDALAWRSRAQGRTLVLCSDDVIELREGESTRARFATMDSVQQAFALSERRWCVVGRRSIVVISDEPPAVLAGASFDFAPALVDVGVAQRYGRVVVKRDVNSNGVAPLPSQRAPRVLANVRRAPPRRVVLDIAAIADSIDRHAKTADEVDRDRLASILALAQDEQWSDGAAWERLVARGLVRASPARHELSVCFSGGAPMLGVGLLDRVIERQDKRAAWLALAHDFERMRTAETIAHELIARIRPWLIAAPKKVEWWGASMASNVMWWPFERARSSVCAVLECAELASISAFSLESAVLNELWAFASASGEALPDFAPGPLAETPFSSVPSPFDPYVALLRLGIDVVQFDEEALALGLAGINEEGERERPIDDIPF